MFSLTGTWRLLRVAGERAARGLAAAEPRSLVRHAQHNAATALLLGRARRLEVGEIGPDPMEPEAAQGSDRLPHADFPEIGSIAPTTSVDVQVRAKAAER